MSSVAILTKPGERIRDTLVIPDSLNDPTRFICGPSDHGCRNFVSSPYLIHQPLGPTLDNARFRHMIQPIAQAGPETDWKLLQALDEFGSDTMLALANIGQAIQNGAETGYRALFETTNGHVTGIAGSIEAKVSEVISKIQQLNLELHKYANTQSLHKNAAKASVRNAYRAMQQEFNIIAEQTVNYYKGGRESALRSMKHGIEVAERYKNRALPLATLPEVNRLTKMLSAAKHVTRIGLLLDLGLRVKKVDHAFYGNGGSTYQGIKTAFEEAIGFTSSYLLAGLTLKGTSLFFCAFMGPFGLVPAILISGAVGLGTDFVGKSVGGWVAKNLNSAGFLK